LPLPAEHPRPCFIIPVSPVPCPLPAAGRSGRDQPHPHTPPPPATARPDRRPWLILA